MMVVDRIEGDIAVMELEDGSHEDIPLDELPDGVREGSVIIRTERGYELDPAAEAERRRRAAELTRRLFGKK